MSYLDDTKITDGERDARHVQAADDRLTGSAPQNKAVFDALPEYIVTKHNALITALQTKQTSVDGNIADIQEDITDIETKLATVEEGAEVNVQADWSQYIDTADDYIKNKPTIPSDTNDLTNGAGFISAETDPVFSASVSAGITSDDIEDWNSKSDFSGDYDDLTNKPTIPTDTSDLTNGAGFITSESDPVFSASEAAGITSTDIANWNAKQAALVSGTNIKTINNESILGSGNIVIQGGGVTDVTQNGTSVLDGTVAKVTVPTKVSDLNNDSGFLTSESDPVFTASVAHGITSTDITNWNDKLSSETDPVFSASIAAGITSTDISTWSGKQDALVSGTNIKTINNTSILGSGNIDIQGGGGSTKNIWYATCSTGASTQAKVASTTSNDFALVTGNMVRVQFDNAQSYNGTATLNVDGTGAKDIARVGTTKTTRYYWTAGEVVDLVYDGTNFVMSAKGTATTSYYGLTKLSSSTSSTSTELAATPSAVKEAYDLADSKSDFSGSYTDLTNKPTIPTDTGDLTNGAGYLTCSDLVNLIYPIGSIYMSVNNVSPQTFLGGDWQSINGRFLVAQGDNGESPFSSDYLDLTAGATGGYTNPQNSAHSHGAGTLTADSKNLAHTHTLNNHTHTLGNHTHGPGGESSTHFMYRNSDSGTQTRSAVGTSGSAYTWRGTTAGGFNSSTATAGPSTNTSGGSNVASGAMSANADHGHTISGSTDSISNVVSGNLPPYLAVYMWKRTA